MMQPLHESAPAGPLGSNTSQAALIVPLLSIDDLAELLKVSRRMVERLRSSGRLPRADLMVGRMPRWRPESVRRWLDEQARGRGGRP